MEDLPAVMEQRMTAVRKGQFDVEIVQSVQQRKVLYDKSHEHHKNPRVKEVEWQRIGEELQGMFENWRGKPWARWWGTRVA